MSEEISIASELLIELADRYGGGEPTLVLGGQAELANAIGGEVLFVPTDIRERDRSLVPTAAQAPADFARTVLIAAPPDRDLLRRQVLVAAQRVVRGGRIILCGANAEGGKSAVKDATDLLGAPVWSGYREKHRMAIYSADQLLQPAWAMEAGIAPGTWQAFAIQTPVGEIPLETQAGVFAGAKLDAGTRLLLDHLDISPGDHVLDLGCGAGIIGIVAAKMGAGHVTMTDANLLAVETASHNATYHHISAKVLASDVYRHLGDGRFDLIVSNPPFHQGKQVDFTVANNIISGAAARLNPGGSLVIVANAFLAYGKQMEAMFGDVESIAATPQYHVLRAIN